MQPSDFEPSKNTTAYNLNRCFPQLFLRATAPSFFLARLQAVQTRALEEKLPIFNTGSYDSYVFLFFPIYK